MSDFSLPTIFVVPSGTLASTGSTQDLTAGQLGIFRQDYTLATAGNIAAAKYFYIAQGRKFPIPSLGSKRSDKISSNPLRIKEWYKITAEDTAANEIWTVSNFKVSCGETVHVQIMAHSAYIHTAAYNGLTKVVSAQAPCCDCGEVPCADIDAADVQALVDELVRQINVPARSLDGSSQLILSTFFSASRTGTGAASVLKIEAKPLPTYSNAFLPTSYPYEYDRLWFQVVPFKNPDTTQDFYVEDRCEIVATAAVVQRSTYITGSSEEIKLLERNHQSYQTYFKEFYAEGGWNNAFESFVADGTFYDTYYLKFIPSDLDYSWNAYVQQDATVIVAFPTGTGGAFETVMTAALGAPKDQSGENITTTTTTSTSSTTTTSTTVLLP